MIIRKFIWLGALICAFAATFPVAALASSEAQVRQMIRDATRNFRDLTMDVEITQVNQNELAKIGKDYGKAYEFKNSRLIFKSPDKFKMTARAGIVNVTYIVTGDVKRIKAGLISKTDDISDDPHKKQTVLDVGVVSETIWDHFDVKYERTEMVDGKPVYVLSLSLWNAPQRKQFIWFDDQMRLQKREKREVDGSLRSRYLYRNHRRHANAVWVPGEVRVFNSEGKLGGTSVYRNIKVNTGVSDNEFR